tara:strand:- start:1350 stop:2435 length:1086 start_codon:yes stop_codon:yes gene_type:complete
LYISKDGYMETVLVNETAEDVWFDDFSVSRTPSLVIQETHYDPWGLELVGLGFQNGGVNENKYLYNGKELIEDNDLQYYDYGARMYDPVLGRWGVVDPIGNLYYSWSPYNYTLNNPIKNIDPDGRFVGTVVGAVVGGVAGAVDAYVNNKNMALSIAEGATAGAVAGAVIDLTVATGGGAAVVFGEAVAGGALGGAVGDLVGQTNDNVLNNNQSIGEALRNVDGSQVGEKAINGAISGVIGGALGAGTSKLMQGVTNSANALIATVGESIESTAQNVMKQGVSKMTTNGVTSYSQAPGLTGKVQGIMDNIVTGMGQSGRAAANGIATTNAVATGATEIATKTETVQSTSDYVKEAVSGWFDW